MKVYLLLCVRRFILNMKFFFLTSILVNTWFSIYFRRVLTLDSQAHLTSLDKYPPFFVNIYEHIVGNISYNLIKSGVSINCHYVITASINFNQHLGTIYAVKNICSTELYDLIPNINEIGIVREVDKFILHCNGEGYNDLSLMKLKVPFPNYLHCLKAARYIPNDGLCLFFMASVEKRGKTCHCRKLMVLKFNKSLVTHETENELKIRYDYTSTYKMLPGSPMIYYHDSNPALVGIVKRAEWKFTEVKKRIFFTKITCSLLFEWICVKVFEVKFLLLLNNRIRISFFKFFIPFSHYLSTYFYRSFIHTYLI